MNYQSALFKIEQWLDEKGIREHCRSICKGKCCQAICNDRPECKRPPLPCAVFLCNDLREKLFGFHNGEKYHETYLKITSIVFGSDEWDMGKMAMVDVDVEIPDKLIQDIITKGYEPDVH